MLSRCSQIKVILAQSAGNLLYWPSDQIFAIRRVICFMYPLRLKGSFAFFIRRAEKGANHRFITRDIVCAIRGCVCCQSDFQLRHSRFHNAADTLQRSGVIFTLSVCFTITGFMSHTHTLTQYGKLTH